jgi:hypothetical protein
MDVDVAGSLEYFTRHGGCCCSCEVPLNVAARASQSVCGRAIIALAPTRILGGGGTAHRPAVGAAAPQA